MAQRGRPTAYGLDGHVQDQIIVCVRQSLSARENTGLQMQVAFLEGWTSNSYVYSNTCKVCFWRDTMWDTGTPGRRYNVIQRRNKSLQCGTTHFTVHPSLKIQASHVSQVPCEFVLIVFAELV